MENTTFTYQYSATRNREVEAIRRKYLPKEENRLETLKRLDRRVQSAGMIAGLCLGIGGALVFGTGLCFFLGALTGAPWLTAFLMIAGTLLMLPAYPVCKRKARSARKALTPEILRLSEEIIHSTDF